MARTVVDALAEAKKQRDTAKTPEEKQRVIGEQIVDALIGIRWALVAIGSQIRPK